MRTGRSLSVGLMATACASTGSMPPSRTTIPATSIGQHAFRAELPGGAMFAGLMVVTEDTMVPRPSEGECRVATTNPNRQHFVYTCTIPGTPDVMLALDRTNPLRRSTWGVTASVRKTRQKCTDYRTWENGTRTCTRSEPEEYFDSVQVQGTLQVTPP